MHDIVSRENWLRAHRALRDKEKELTRAHDRLAAERRRLHDEYDEGRARESV